MRSRDRKASARFFRKVLKAQHTQAPRVITVDKNAAYPVARNKLKADETIAEETELRQIKYLNNIIEQDYRNIKRIVKKFATEPANALGIRADTFQRSVCICVVLRHQGLPSHRFKSSTDMPVKH